MANKNGGGAPLNLDVLGAALGFDEGISGAPIEVNSMEDVMGTSDTADTTTKIESESTKASPVNKQPAKTGTKTETAQEEEVSFVEGELDFSDEETETEDDKADKTATGKTGDPEKKDKKNPEKEVEILEPEAFDDAPDKGLKDNKNPLKVFAYDLAQNSIIDFDENDFDKAEDKDEYLSTKVAEKITEGIEFFKNEFKSTLPPEIDELIEYHKKGIPLHAILEANKEVATYESIPTEEIANDERLQRDLVTDMLVRQGFSEEKAKARVKKFEDLGVLADEATDAHQYLIDQSKKDKEQRIKQEEANTIARQEAIEAQIKQVKDNIQNTKEIFPGIKLNDVDKKKMINGIFETVGTDKSGRPINALQKARMEDPTFDLKMAYLTLVLNGDLTKLSKQIKTQEVKKLSQVIDENPLASSYRTGSNDSNNAKTDPEVLKSTLSWLKRKGS